MVFPSILTNPFSFVYRFKDRRKRIFLISFIVTEGDIKGRVLPIHRNCKKEAAKKVEKSGKKS